MIFSLNFYPFLIIKIHENLDKDFRQKNVYFFVLFLQLTKMMYGYSYNGKIWNFYIIEKEACPAGFP